MTLLSVATLATLAAAVPGSIPTSDLKVKIEAHSGTTVKGTVTNSGSDDLKVVRPGSILDSGRVQKAVVSNQDGEVKFAGIAKFIAPDTSKLGYQEIPAGQTVEVTFDVAEM